MRKIVNDLLCIGLFQMFNNEVAVKLGLNCAIVLQTLHRRLLYHARGGNGTNHIDGKFWNYCSLNDWKKTLPYMGKSTIARALKKLRQLGLIRTGQFKKNGTDYCTINYRKLYELGFDLNCGAIEQAGLCGIEMYFAKRPTQNGTAYAQNEPEVSQSKPEVSQGELKVSQNETDYIQ